MPGTPPALGEPVLQHSQSWELPSAAEKQLGRIVGTTLPILYIWSLPALAESGFAHKCEHYPRCGSTGMSVSNFISNAHATGAMAACFFYPAVFMWLNALHVRHDRLVYPTLVAFQVCFGLFLACPITEAPGLHAPAVCLFCVSGLAHCGVILKRCSVERLRGCLACLIVSMLAFVSVFSLTVADASGAGLGLRVPPLFWLSECIGLSGMIMFPFLWHREHGGNGAGSGETFTFQLPEGSSRSAFQLIGTALPVLYVWSLPGLAELGFANKCTTFPRCGSNGVSVSNLIANARATGAMAACCFYPALHLWLNAQYVRHRKYVYPTLALFQASFGAFLACPITEVIGLHSMAVLTFCIAALVHYGVVLRYCASDQLRKCQVLLCAAIAFFGVLIVLTGLSKLMPELLQDHVPWFYYVMDCCGLTAMVLFPLQWYRESQQHDLEISARSVVSCT